MLVLKRLRLKRLKFSRRKRLSVLKGLFKRSERPKKLRNGVKKAKAIQRLAKQQEKQAKKEARLLQRQLKQQLRQDQQSQKTTSNQPTKARKRKAEDTPLIEPSVSKTRIVRSGRSIELPTRFRE